MIIYKTIYTLYKIEKETMLNIMEKKKKRNDKLVQYYNIINVLVN